MYVSDIYLLYISTPYLYDSNSCHLSLSQGSAGYGYGAAIHLIYNVYSSIYLFIYAYIHIYIYIYDSNSCFLPRQGSAGYSYGAAAPPPPAAAAPFGDANALANLIRGFGGPPQ